MAPKTKEQFAEIRSQSEEKILAAALELFAEKGFKSTSISEIARTAGVSKGLMYNYFDSKQELLRKIVSNTISMGHRMMGAGESSSPEEELEHIVLESIAQIKENIQLWKLLTMLSLQKEVMDSIADLVEDFRKLSIEMGMSLFTKLKSPNPMSSALLFGASLDGIFFHYLHLVDEYPIDEMGKLLIDTFLNNKSIHRST